MTDRSEQGEGASGRGTGWAGVALLAVLGVGLPLLALEIAAGFLVDPPWGKSLEELLEVHELAFTPHSFTPDPELDYILSPSFEGRMVRRDEFDVTFRTNTLGLRDRDFGAGGAETRILFVGDSFVFGTGLPLERTLPKVVETRLAGSAPVEVLNAGVGGYGIDQYALWADRLVAAYEPDVVLVGLFIGNDLIRYAAPGAEGRKPRYVVREGFRSRATGDLVYRLRRHSDAAYLLLERVPRLLALLRPPKELRRAQADPREVVWTARPHLAALGALAARQAFELGFVVLPDKREFPTQRATLNETAAPASAPAVIESLERRHAALLVLLDEMGVPYIDVKSALGPVFAEELYFERDGHFSPRGSQHVGNLIADWTRATLLRR